MTSDVHRARRRHLVEKLAADGIADPAALRALGAVPRHLFVPADLAEDAYLDCPLPIGEGQTISQPYVVAFMTAALRVGPGSRVLEVGTGSGYQAAVLVELGCEVWSVEVRPDRAEAARRNLEDAGYGGRVHLRLDDGAEGWPEAAPFDAIVVTAGAPDVPPALVAQLADGGRLVMPVGDREEQALVRITRAGDATSAEALLPVVFVPLVEGPKRRRPAGAPPVVGDGGSGQS